MGGGKTFVAILGIFSIILFSGLDALSLRTYNLDDYCGRTISLPCADDGWGRAGVLQFSSYTSRTCTVNVTMETSSFCTYNEYYSIYFNIKGVNIGSSDSFVVYEKSDNYPYITLVKSISGSNTPNTYNPTSYGQLKSMMIKKPLLSITFNKISSYSPVYSPYITLDYNVVHDTPLNSDSYCSALSGYVADDLLCETGDRVNCPSTYTASTGYNPAYWKNQGYPEFQVCYVLGAGEIVGIAIGSLVGLTLLIGLVSICCRRQRVVHRHVAGVSVPVSNVHTAYVNGGYQQYPGQQPVFAGAPPPYGAVYPQPGPAGANVMPQPPNM